MCQMMTCTEGEIKKPCVSRESGVCHNVCAYLSTVRTAASAPHYYIPVDAYREAELSPMVITAWSLMMGMMKWD